MKEIWKDIKNYEGYYQVSNLGRVRSLPRYDSNNHRLKGRILKTTIRSGYYNLNLSKGNKRKSYQVHRLVAMAFIPTDDYSLFINHIDINRLNNKVSNLEWCTQKENVNHSSFKMRHRKKITKSNTNERYIHYRKNYNNYELTIDKRYYGKYKTLEEAKIARKNILAKLSD